MKLGGAVNRGLGLLGLQTVGNAAEEMATRADGEEMATRAGAGDVGFELVNVAGGGRLSRRQVEGIAAAFACVDVISTAIAALPAVIERVGPEGREVVTDHPLAKMFVRPNLWQTWPDFIQWLVDVQGECPLNCSAKMSLGYSGIVSDVDAGRLAGDRRVGGFSASM